MMTTIRRLRTSVAAILALGACFGARAAEPTTPPPQLSEAVSTALLKVNQFMGAEQWDTALLTVREVLKTATPRSYDWAMAQLLLAQIHLSRNKRDLGDYVAAIPALEAVLGSGFFTPAQTLEWRYVLAQLCAQEDKLGQAEKYLREWLQETPAPTADAYILLTTLVVQRAQEDPAKPDRKLSEEALALTRKGLLIGAKPVDTLYYLQAACFQQLERWDEAAEVLELLLQKTPRNKSYWNQLFGMYVTGENDLRAAMTIERAHQYEAMNSPRENIALAQLYYNMQQFDRAIEILEKGLTDGSIEPTRVHWEMLGRGYQELHQEFKSIQTFLRADKHFDNGYFLYLAGNTYYAMGRNADALKYLEQSVKKGVENPTQVALFAGFLAFELREYDRASALLDVAEKNLNEADDRQRNDYRSLREAVIQGQKQVEAEQAAEAAAPDPR